MRSLSFERTLALALLAMVSYGSDSLVAEDTGPVFVEQSLSEDWPVKAYFVLKNDQNGKAVPYYTNVECARPVKVRQKIGNASIEDEGKVVVVNGKLVIQHRVGIVDLSQPPKGSKSFDLPSPSCWTALKRPSDSAGVWQIQADPGSTLEILVDLKSREGEDPRTPLYLAPGIKGRIHLAKGEAAVVFGTRYDADQDETLLISWGATIKDGVPEGEGIKVTVELEGRATVLADGNHANDDSQRGKPYLFFMVCGLGLFCAIVIIIVVVLRSRAPHKPTDRGQTVG